GRDRGGAERDGLARLELVIDDRKRQWLGRRPLVERGEQTLHPALGPLGSIDHERTRARGLVEGFHEEERHAAEMVSVQMGDQHRVQLRQVPWYPLRRLQDARAAVEQEGRAVDLREVGAVKATPGAERVPGTEHGDAHDALWHRTGT